MNNETEQKKKWLNFRGRFFLYFGIVLIFGSLMAVALRNYTIASFEDSEHKSFMAPAGKMMHSDVVDFSFAAVSDTGARNESGEFIMNEIRKSSAKFVLYVGDLVRYRNPSHFKWMAEEIDEKLGKLNLYAVPGNHEVLSVDGKVDRTLYHEIFGQTYYWFSYGDVLFIGLDSSTESYDDEQLKWLEKTLKKIRPQFKYCVIYSHVPPVNVKTPNSKRLDNHSRDKFAKVIRDRGINLLISGHVHFFSESLFEGIPLVTLPSSGQPIRSEIKKFGYVTFDMSENGLKDVTVKFVKVGDDVERFESFMSNAFVKTEINDVALWIFALGMSLVLLGWVTKR